MDINSSTKLIIATHNAGKLREIIDIVEKLQHGSLPAGTIVSAGELELDDVQETGVTFEENALLKAQTVAKTTGIPALADDSGLIVDILGFAPGILSARWAGVHGDDVANNELLLAQLEDIPDKHRTARFVTAAAVAFPDGRNVVEVGEMKGKIIRKMIGTNGFGYDSIFVPNEQKVSMIHPQRTSAQMTADEKNAISHRTKAILKVADVIVNLCL